MADISRKVGLSATLVKQILVKNNIIIRKNIRTLGQKASKETIEKLKKRPKYIRTETHKKKMSLIIKGLNRFGSNNPNWKNIQIQNYIRERKSKRYNEWRNKVFKRDSYTCQITNIKSKGDIEVHHIENFSSNIDKRYDINNGITLQKDIHKQFHLIYGYKNNTYEQLIEFKDKVRKSI